MPTIYDNINKNLRDGLRSLLVDACSCSFCVGYLNLRGWGEIADLIDQLPTDQEATPCRVLVGMYRPPEEEMRLLQGLKGHSQTIDGPTLALFKRKIVEGFRQQLEFGIPTLEAQKALRKLAQQIRNGKLKVKAFLRYPLHAKLYLIERKDPVTPLIGFIGSSNLTKSGLTQQGELNVDVVEQDAAHKLKTWFEERWNDPLSFDLSQELAQLIETSWAGLEHVRPYLVYLKMAYHLSEEARRGEKEFRLPKVFQRVLLDFQKAAVSLAAQYLYRRGGVLLGDVVGLGKTLMATAIAKILQEDSDSNTLIICPPKLKEMWQFHVDQYQITAKVISLGEVIQKLPQLPRYRLVIIDESHNLRNREGKRYQAIAEYIELNESRVILITATPYNKHFEDLSNQIRLFIDENLDLHIRPEKFFQWWRSQGKTESEFMSRYNTLTTSLRAFEKSPFAEDWRDLMRLFLVRRTRNFIMRNYAKYDPEKQRYYVSLNGNPHYFPIREPHTLKFPVRESDPKDQYAKLFREEIVNIIAGLNLPRYGLANYLVDRAEKIANDTEKVILRNLNRAGRRLIGFRRTNLFKRLESSGFSFLLSVRRHMLRDLITLYALENNFPIPIGTQDPALLDTAISDAEIEFAFPEDSEENGVGENRDALTLTDDFETLKNLARQNYEKIRNEFAHRFQWLDPKFFDAALKSDIQEDISAMQRILQNAGTWTPENDEKLKVLYHLLTETHPKDKVLIFTQFADTANYLAEQLQSMGIQDLAVVTSSTNDPVGVVRRFSPATNGGLRSGESELRVLISTDVLAEGQNLQDAHIVVNYDLPWAIIRLIQRAGRVDRIGQQHDTILVYSFLPADGVEKLIRLRQRLVKRLRENNEVIGTDESFFGETEVSKLHDLYTEKAGVLDDDEDTEDIDIASLAFQVWNSASEKDRKAAMRLPPVVSASMALPEDADPHTHPSGVITYLRFPDGTDALVRVDENGNLVSQSISAIFRAAACSPDTPPLDLTPNHYELVAQCAKIVYEAQITFGGQLGSMRSTSRRVYERLIRYRNQLRSQPDLFSKDLVQDLNDAIEMIFRYPLKRKAQESLGRQIRLGIPDEELAQLVISMMKEDRLCKVQEGPIERQEPQIICSLGLQSKHQEGFNV